MKLLRASVVIVATLTLTGVLSASASAPALTSAKKVTLPSGATGVPQGYLPNLSCVSAGNCVAAGSYSNAAGDPETLIIAEVNGVWKSPYTLKAPSGAAAQAGITVYGISCAKVGYCAAVGNYSDSAGNVQGFVASEVAGSWKGAEKVGLPTNALGTGQDALVRSVTCSTPTACSAVGDYVDNSPTPKSLGFVLDEVSGTWQKAREITLPSSTNFNPFVTMSQIGCSSSENCVAAGSYINANDVTETLVVSERAGSWGNATALSLPPSTSAYAGASLSEVACAKNAACSVLGTFNSSSGALEGLVDTSVQGTWPRATTLTMPANANTNPHVFFYGYQGFACPSSGNCTLGGQYETSSDKYEGFFESEVSGVWRVASELAIPAGAQQAGKNGGVVAITCPSAGSCRAGAAYVDSSGSYQALVVSQTNGTWATGQRVALPGSATSVGVDGGIYALVCVSTTSCTGIGSYLAGATTYQGFSVQS